MKRQIRILGIPIWERRDIQTGPVDKPGQRLMNALGSVKTESSVEVSEKSALTITAVWRAVNIISGAIASLPLQVYKKERGSRQESSDHVVAELLHDPSPLMTGYNFRESMNAVLLMYGNAYAVIKREAGTPRELIPVHPSQVNIVTVDGKTHYNVTYDNRAHTLSADDIVHIPGLSFDGLKGYSPVQVMRESMGLGMAAQKFGARFFGSGANMDGVMEVPGELGDVAYDRLRKSWDETYHSLDNSHKTAILEGGAKYQRIGIPPDQAQFLQTRQFQVAEVARMFGVQPHLLMDLERATHNNIEHQGMEFVTFTLMPWIKRWESEINRKLFRSKEKKEYYAEFNITGLLRGDSKARSDYYRSMFSIGAMSPNEIRELENEKAYEGGETYFAQGAYTPIQKLKKQDNE